MSDFYKLSAKLSTGERLEFSRLRGSVILIVNTASQCGFTPQYVGLQNMYDKHQHNNFKILAFPCNQFGGQEPGTSEEIVEFCSNNFSAHLVLLAFQRVHDFHLQALSSIWVDIDWPEVPFHILSDSFKFLKNAQNSYNDAFKDPT